MQPCTCPHTGAPARVILDRPHLVFLTTSTLLLADGFLTLMAPSTAPARTCAEGSWSCYTLSAMAGHSPRMRCQGGSRYGRVLLRSCSDVHIHNSRFASLGIRPADCWLDVRAIRHLRHDDDQEFCTRIVKRQHLSKTAFGWSRRQNDSLASMARQRSSVLIGPSGHFLRKKGQCWTQLVHWHLVILLGAEDKACSDNLTPCQVREWL